MIYEPSKNRTVGIEMHYYNNNIADFRKDTTHLTLLEQGVYRRLMDQYYLDEKPLSLDHASLMRSHCVRTAEEKQALENVLQDFFVRTENGYIHKRCDIEIEAFHAKSNSASESAKARWERVRAEKEAAAMRTHSDGNANQEPITNNHKPEKVKSIAPSGASVSPKFSALVFLVERGVDAQVAKDWLATRKAKKLAPTETAIGNILAAIEGAGMTCADGIKLCTVRGWGGFNKSWLENDGQARASPGRAWWETDASTLAKGEEMNMRPHAGESMGTFKGRLQAAIDNGGVPVQQKQSRILSPPDLPKGRMPEGLDLKALVKGAPT